MTLTTTGGPRGAISPPVGLGQSPGGGSGDEAPGSLREPKLGYIW